MAESRLRPEEPPRQPPTAQEAGESPPASHLVSAPVRWTGSATAAGSITDPRRERVAGRGLRRRPSDLLVRRDGQAARLTLSLTDPKKIDETGLSVEYISVRSSTSLSLRW